MQLRNVPDSDLEHWGNKTLKDAVTEFEGQIIEQTVVDQPTLAAAAQVLGIDVSTLTRKRRRYRQKCVQNCKTRINAHFTKVTSAKPCRVKGLKVADAKENTEQYAKVHNLAKTHFCNKTVEDLSNWAGRYFFVQRMGLVSMGQDIYR